MRRDGDRADVTLAALDPGSARCGLVIAAHAPPAALALLHHQLFPVGHLEELAAPVTTTTRPARPNQSAGAEGVAHAGGVRGGEESDISGLGRCVER